MTDWEVSGTGTEPFPPGYWRRQVRKMKEVATREALSVMCTPQPEARKGQAGPAGWRRGSYD